MNHSQQSDDSSKTYTDEIGTDPSLTGTDNLEEAGCGDHASPGGRNDDKKCSTCNKKPCECPKEDKKDTKKTKPGKKEWKDTTGDNKFTKEIINYSFLNLGRPC